MSSWEMKALGERSASGWGRVVLRSAGPCKCRCQLPAGN
jgi:hypothetical protein